MGLIVINFILKVAVGIVMYPLRKQNEGIYFDVPPPKEKKGGGGVQFDVSTRQTKGWGGLEGIDFTPSQTKERGGGYCAPSSNLNPESIPARKVELDIGLVYITTG